MIALRYRSATVTLPAVRNPPDSEAMPVVRNMNSSLLCRWEEKWGRDTNLGGAMEAAHIDTRTGNDSAYACSLTHGYNFLDGRCDGLGRAYGAQKPDV